MKPKIFIHFKDSSWWVEDLKLFCSIHIPNSKNTHENKLFGKVENSLSFNYLQSVFDSSNFDFLIQIDPKHIAKHRVLDTFDREVTKLVSSINSDEWDEYYPTSKLENYKEFLTYLDKENSIV